MEYHTFHTILLVIICLLWLMIIASNCHYVKHRLKQKTYYHFNNVKIAKNTLLKEIYIKNCTCY